VDSPSLRAVVTTSPKKKPPLISGSSFKRMVGVKVPEEKKKAPEEKKNFLKPLTRSPWLKPDSTIPPPSPCANSEAIRGKRNQQEDKKESLKQLQEAKAITSSKDKTLTLCACGCPCEAIKENVYQKNCKKCASKAAPSFTSGYLYEKVSDQLHRYWYKIMGQYFYSIIKS
jgi:hypothetical protein